MRESVRVSGQIRAGQTGAGRDRASKCGQQAAGFGPWGRGWVDRTPTGGFNSLLAGMFLRAHFTSAAAEACPLD